ATVSGQTPTGTVTFLDGATAIGTAPLDGTGAASLTTSALAPGSHAIAAKYPGDANFSKSMSTVLSQTVGAPPPPDFSVGASPNSLTITAGQSGSIVFTVTPLNGFVQTVSFGCGNLPARATCTFDPLSVTPGGTHAVTSTLTIRTVSNAGPAAQLAGFGALSFLSLGVLVLRGPRRRAAPWALCLAFAILLAACGGGGGGGSGGGGNPAQAGTPPGAYSVSITGTAGAANKSIAVSVTVQ